MFEEEEVDDDIAVLDVVAHEQLLIGFTLLKFLESSNSNSAVTVTKPSDGRTFCCAPVKKDAENLSGASLPTRTSWRECNCGRGKILGQQHVQTEDD